MIEGEIKIGDWIVPIDPVVDGINYGYNKRVVIAIHEDEFTTVCDASRIEEGLWNIYNTEFIGRVIFEI